MTESGQEIVEAIELREGDICDFSEQVVRYDLTEVPDLGGVRMSIGNPANATVSAALLRLGHDQVIIVTDQISLALPTTEQIRRIRRAGNPT